MPTQRVAERIRPRRSVETMGRLGGFVLLGMVLLCIVTLPWTLAATDDTGGPRRFESANPDIALLPPSWAPHSEREHATRDAHGGSIGVLLFGTDRLGRDLFVRVLTGGGISLLIGLAAAATAVCIGTVVGTIAGWRGGWTDAVLMRIVDVLYGLPAILLVVLLAVAIDGWRSTMVNAGPDVALLINGMTLWIAIGAISWLTIARVVRGQVLSLKARPFMEACRAIGVPWPRQFFRHMLPNLMGPIIVYATLTVPMAMLAEAFLSFLGIGIREPLPSWGNLAADGLGEINLVRSRWWLLLWPCLFIGLTLLSLNLVGEWLRMAFDPRQRSEATDS
ncbi:MAG: ABC transporter permease [Phycisphaerales bacterium]|nr:ABC transporter permease [Phycisphaerales bacterium]